MGTSLIPRNTLSHTSARLCKERSRGAEEAKSQSLVVLLDAGQERAPRHFCSPIHSFPRKAPTGHRASMPAHGGNLSYLRGSWEGGQ